VKVLNDLQVLINGEVISQASLSNQSEVTQMTTYAKYSHCGIIYENNGRYFDFAAKQPVKKYTFGKRN
jgi:hypothetical protein